MQPFTIIKRRKFYKGQYYIKILDSIKKIENFSQVEPTRKLIELFGWKTGDTQLKDELLEHLFEKAKHYQHYDFIHLPRTYAVAL